MVELKMGARERILSLLPHSAAAELSVLASGRLRFWDRLQELRLRAPGRSSLVFGNRQRVLSARVDAGEMEALLLCLCGGSRYAFEECISEGYLPFEGGIRIGVCGRAHYEGEVLRGICDVSSLVIRFPHASEVASVPVLEAFCRAKRGLLIYSPPGVGKTTALRALARALGEQNPPRRVVVIDERLEFAPEEYENSTVDVLRGYHREAALRIAYRSMNPEVILLDEIGGREEAEALAALLRGGATAVATAHAASREDLYLRGVLSPFFEREIFDVFLALERRDGRVFYRMEEERSERSEMQECSAILV